MASQLNSRPLHRAPHTTGWWVTLRIFLAMTLAVLALPFLGSSASAAVTTIDIDGDQDGLTDDWQGSGVTPITDPVGTLDTTTFGTQNTSESTYPSWNAGSPGTASGKSDIGNVLVYDLKISGDTWGFFAWDRAGDSGTGRYYIELNQTAHTALAPTRVDGDVRITVAVSGTDALECQAIEQWDDETDSWVAPTGGSTCHPTVLFAVNSDGDKDTDDSIQDYFDSPNADEDDMLGSNKFVEAAVNLTDFGLTTCPVSGFQTVHFRSQEGGQNGDTSALKDYAVGPINIESDCGKLTIVKQLNGVADLAGAEGAVFKVSPNPETGIAGSYTTVTTGATGSAAINEVKPGITYEVTELVPPSGYLLPASNNPQSILVGEGEQKTLTFDDVLGDGTFTKSYGGDNPTTTGATFTLTRTHRWVYDGDPAGEIDDPVKAGLTLGNQRVVTVTDNGTASGGTTVTDGDSRMGFIEVSGLEGGTWRIDETAAPTGWQQDAPVATASFDIGPTDADDEQSKSLNLGRNPSTFHNALRPIGLELTKVKEIPGVTGTTPHQGVTFNLYRDDGDRAFEPVEDGPLVSRITDANGDAAWFDLNWQKEYWLEEVKAEGYAVGLSPNPTLVSFAAPSNNTTVLELPTITNLREEVSIQLNKVGDPDGALLDGGGFRLYRESNDQAGWQTTDTLVNPGEAETLVEGTLRFGANEYHIPWGFTYYLYEAEAPTGYGLMSPNPIVISTALSDLSGAGWDAGMRTLTFAATDPQLKSNIRVLKYDATTYNPNSPSSSLLDGAKFRLYEDDGVPVNGGPSFNPETGDDELFATEDGLGTVGGTLTWTNLNWGTYWVLEVSRPTGYLEPLGGNPKLVTLNRGNAGTTVDAVFKNPQTLSDIKVNKYDATTYNPNSPSASLLDGARFRLFLDDGELVGGEPVFDAEADTALTGNVAGVGTSGGSFTWSDLAWGTYWVQEVSPPSGYLSPLGDNPKLVVLDDTNFGETEVVEFFNPQAPSGIQVFKHDANTYSQANPDASLIDGAIFRLYKDSGPNGPDNVFDPATDTAITGPNGQGTTGGTFIWSDLTFGTYWLVESSPPVGYGPPTGANPVAVVIDASNASQTIERHFLNPRLPVDVRVVKRDAVDQSFLAGASFQLYRDLGTIGAPDAADVAVGGVLVTGAGGTVQWDDLTWGRYIVVETSPPAGYALSNPAFQAFELGVADAQAALVSFTFNNPRLPVGVRVEKRDAVTGALIDTARFKLWSDSGTAAGVLDSGDTLIGTEVSTGTNGNPVGTYSWSGLAWGGYLLEESVAPQGYELSEPAVQAFSVGRGEAGTTVTRTFNNPQSATTVEVLKVDDETEEVLEGATFQAYADDGSTPGELDDTDTPIGEPVVTDAEGLASWSGLLFGSYLFEEVTAPVGYGLPEETVQAVVINASNAGGVIRLTFLDPAQGTIGVSKAAFEFVGGEWVESDGLVAFGDRVRYVVTVEADGPKIHHDVVVSDYIPGNDPDDTTSDTLGVYEAGTAVCVDEGECTVSFDSIEQLLTWELGDLRDETRTVEFVIGFPALTSEQIAAPGLYTGTLGNVAAAAWSDRLGDQEVGSNEVVVEAETEILGVDEERPPVEKPKPRPPAILPATGAPVNAGLWSLLGGLMVALGAALLLRRRRELS